MIRKILFILGILLLFTTSPFSIIAGLVLATASGISLKMFT
jgi:hypothetical protein